ncbi:hypothetical protein [Pilimelia terevasa]|nr:hypothetical protein [Pilimelia terevasa]
MAETTIAPTRPPCVNPDCWRPGTFALAEAELPPGFTPPAGRADVRACTDHASDLYRVSLPEGGWVAPWLQPHLTP